MQPQGVVELGEEGRVEAPERGADALHVHAANLIGLGLDRDQPDASRGQAASFHPSASVVAHSAHAAYT